MKFSDFLNEVSQKDWDRMQTLSDKGQSGTGVAKSIKDKVKAIDRYVAGLKIKGLSLGKPPFTGDFADFGNKAIELGATLDDIKKAFDEAGEPGSVSDKPASKKTEWTPKTRKSDSEPKDKRHQRSAILSIGAITISSGNSKYFNVYSEWGETSTYEIWETAPRKYRIVVTSGKRPIYDIGDQTGFKGDQSGRDLGTGKLVDWAVGTELKDVGRTYGSSIPAYVYK